MVSHRHMIVPLTLPFVAKGASVTFLLRSPSGLQADDAIKPYIQSGKARLVKGDAMNFEDVSKGWEEALAAGDGTVDLAIFTVGKSRARTHVWPRPHHMRIQVDTLHSASGKACTRSPSTS